MVTTAKFVATLLRLLCSRRDIETALLVSWDENPSVALAEIRLRHLRADRQALVQRHEQ